jgi:flagellar biosynthetic protein FliO
VAPYKRKSVLILTIGALGIAALVLCTGQSAEKKNSKFETQNSKQAAASLFANDPNFAGRSDSSLSSREMFFKLMISVLLVGGLGAAAIYTSRKLLPRITNLPGKKIRIIETVHLGPRKAIHLVEIGNQQILVGSTNENIRKLADVTDAFVDLSTKTIGDDVEI